MSRFFFTLAFAIGLAAIAWIGQGFIRSDQLALAFTGLIALVYCLGFGELVGFRRSTQQLQRRLQTLPESAEQVSSWLDELPPAMQFPTQRRIEGHAAALPGPQLTPYLTGLLVMLGLLGTFAGMVVTLGGAASALDGSTELSAIRGALAAPIAGLSLAFGTSIAGVAASAMLGLASTLSRRDRLLASRQLDGLLREKLHHLSADHQRQQAFRALEVQAKALPEMANTLERMTAKMEQLGQRLEQSLTHNQQAFHNTVGEHYQTLASSVAHSLETAVDSSTRLAAERIEPVVDNAVTRLREDAADAHQNWSLTTTQQLTDLGTGLEAPMSRLIQTASQTQNSAADVIAQLQGKMTRDSERENELLEERQRLVGELGRLLDVQHGTANSQQQAVESLINDAGKTLTDISAQFSTLVQAQSRQLAKLGDDMTGSSQEVGALSEAFHQSVELFNTSNQQIAESLAHVQKALDNAGSRHDEQLAYYVAQAREVIDLSVSSQKDVIEAAATLRQGGGAS